MLSCVVTGLIAAAGAAACFESGYALQAFEARAAPPADALRASLLRRLLARPRWLIGTALTLFGALLQVVALRYAPVVVVQAVLALGLAGLVVLARVVLHERLGVVETAAVVAVAAGVGLIAAGAPERASGVAHTGVLVAAVVVLGGIAAAPFALRSGAPRPRLAVLGAVAGDGLAAVGLKLAADALAQQHWPGVLGGLVLAALSGALGLTAEMSALQRMPASRVGPLVVAGQVVIPVAVAALALGEELSGSPAVGLGLVLVIGGGLRLAASPGAVALRHPEAAEHDARGGGQLAEGGLG